MAVQSILSISSRVRIFLRSTFASDVNPVLRKKIIPVVRKQMLKHGLGSNIMFVKIVKLYQTILHTILRFAIIKKKKTASKYEWQHKSVL